MTRRFLMVALATVLVADIARAQQAVQSELFISGLVQPTEMVEHPSEPGVFFVAEQPGRVRVIQEGVLGAVPVIDISTLIRFGHPERGLVGMAIDPADPTGLYLHYTRNPVGASRVDRFELSPTAPWSADIKTRTPIIDRPQPSVIHSGNALRFGPDGFLYVAYGDGGPVGDPNMQGQNKDSIFGSIARIDPLPAGGYDIPADNPFVGVDGADEIWVYGLRNPWKFSFDVGACGSGGMLIGDVGDTTVEEVDFALPQHSGANFGWSCFEGTMPFFACEPPAGETFTDPIFEYARDTGLGRSVTAGYVYRGAAMPHNRGRAFFGDFIFGRVMSVRLNIDEMTAPSPPMTSRTTPRRSRVRPPVPWACSWVSRATRRASCTSSITTGACSACPRSTTRRTTTSTAWWTPPISPSSSRRGARRTAHPRTSRTTRSSTRRTSPGFLQRGARNTPGESLGSPSFYGDPAHGTRSRHCRAAQRRQVHAL